MALMICLLLIGFFVWRKVREPGESRGKSFAVWLLVMVIIVGVLIVLGA
jgi:hypothetical protein